MDSKQLNYIGFGFSVIHLVEQISYCFSIAYATIYLRAVDFYVSLAMSASLFTIDYVISLALVKKKSTSSCLMVSSSTNFLISNNKLKTSLSLFNNERHTAV